MFRRKVAGTGGDNDSDKKKILKQLMRRGGGGGGGGGVGGQSVETSRIFCGHAKKSCRYKLFPETNRGTSVYGETKSND